MRNWLDNRRMFLVALCALALSGCGGSGSIQPVRGTVKFADGSPLTKGVIVFDNGQTSAIGEIRSDGAFELPDGAETGTHTVFFAGEAAGGEYDKPLLAAKYIQPSQSDIRVEVKPGPNVFDQIVVEKAP